MADPLTDDEYMYPTAMADAIHKLEARVAALEERLAYLADDFAQQRAAVRAKVAWTCDQEEPDHGQPDQPHVPSP